MPPAPQLRTLPPWPVKSGPGGEVETGRCRCWRPTQEALRSRAATTAQPGAWGWHARPEGHGAWAQVRRHQLQHEISGKHAQHPQHSRVTLGKIIDSIMMRIPTAPDVRSRRRKPQGRSLTAGIKVSASCSPATYVRRGHDIKLAQRQHAHFASERRSPTFRLATSRPIKLHDCSPPWPVLVRGE